MARGRDDLDAVGVGVASRHRYVDMGVSGDVGEIPSRGVQGGLETLGDAREHGPGLVAMAEVVVGDAAEAVESVEIRLAGRGVEQDVRRRPEVGVGGQPRKR